MNDLAHTVIRVTGSIAGVLLVAAMLSVGHATALASTPGTPPTGDAIRENLPIILGVIAAAAVILIIAMRKRGKDGGRDAPDGEGPQPPSPAPGAPDDASRAEDPAGDSPEPPSARDAAQPAASPSAPSPAPAASPAGTGAPARPDAHAEPPAPVAASRPAAGDPDAEDRALEEKLSRSKHAR